MVAGDLHQPRLAAKDRFAASAHSSGDVRETETARAGGMRSRGSAVKLVACHPRLRSEVSGVPMARMNLAESLFINSAARVREMRRTIGPRVLESADSTGVRRVLEVGCGQGVGVELILTRFTDTEVVGIDLDPKMIRRAQRRLASRRDRAEVRVGDVCSLPFEDASFDVIVDFAAVHHIPDWRAALGEIARLLVPGGQFLFEDHDVTKHSLFARTFFAHPDERFTAAEFASALADVGIYVDDRLDDRNGHFVGRGIKRAA